MSKTADKAANRSAIKQNWNQQGFRPPAPKIEASSWWVPGAAPDKRGVFVELAQQRAASQWSTITPHLAKGLP